MNKLSYLVEGQNELAAINALKTKYIKAGKVSVFNVLEKDVSNVIRTIDPKSEIALVIDTDVITSQPEQIRMLVNNCQKLVNHTKRVYIITQNKNLEDELISSLNITNILNLYNVESLAKHKNKINTDRNLQNTLEKNGFNNEEFWKTYCLEIQIPKVIEGSEKIKR